MDAVPSRGRVCSIWMRPRIPEGQGRIHPPCFMPSSFRHPATGRSSKTSVAIFSRRSGVTPYTQKHGRSGQAQNGVDVFGRRNGRWQAVQCKRRSTFPETRLTKAEVRAEVKAATEFAQPLETLAIVTTAPPDAGLQAQAMELTELHGEDGPRVVVYGWSELCEKLVLHDKVFRVWRGKLFAQPPVPSFSDKASRELGEALEEAQLRHEELTRAGRDSSPALETILDIKRRLREGGRLQPGDFPLERALPAARAAGTGRLCKRLQSLRSRESRARRGQGAPWPARP